MVMSLEDDHKTATATKGRVLKYNNMGANVCRTCSSKLDSSYKGFQIFESVILITL